ncbi:MAG: hypothetical protein ACTSO3_01350 [Candidatus Heimdallarchaeaceae archaeon]
MFDNLPDLDEWETEPTVVISIPCSKIDHPICLSKNGLNADKVGYPPYHNECFCVVEECPIIPDELKND